MRSVGDPAPEIDANTSLGERFVLSKEIGLCAVVYFFPKAFTPGCTVETKLFRDNFTEIALAGATVVGVSTDDLATQCRFATSLKAPFPLVGDPDKSIARAYDVLWPIIGLAQRVTYVVSPEMRIAAAFHHELGVRRHRDDVLRFVNDAFVRSRPKA